MEAPEFDAVETSTRIYRGDLDYLKRLQLAQAHRAGRWPPMCDVIHGVVEELEENRQQQRRQRGGG